MRSLVRAIGDKQDRDYALEIVEIGSGRLGARACEVSATGSPRRRSIHDDFVTLARSENARPHGPKSRSNCNTSHPDRFSPGITCSRRARRSATRSRNCRVWPHKGSLVLKLKGVDSIDDAEVFLRCSASSPRAASPARTRSAYIAIS